MATIAENLQILVEQKAAIKAALENRGKEPTDKLSTYAGLINELENADQISYVLTNADGTQRAYAVTSGEEAIHLTATANDIRQNTSAITDEGYTEGTKDIPAYHSNTGKKIIQAGSEISITIDRYDYTEFQAILCKYGTSVTDSVEVFAATIDDSVYKACATDKLADITTDGETTTINLGITADTKTVLRYFTMREES